MTNKYTGEVPLKIGAEQGTLVYNWGALGTVESEFTKEELQNMQNLHPDKIARLAEIGFSEHNPEITAKSFKTAKPSPALFEVAKACDQALLYAYHGDEQATAILKRIEEAEQAVQGTQEPAPKKNPKKKPKAK